MIRAVFILLGICYLIPIQATAIEITEIAWMGTDTSPNHEWIELYSPVTVDVTGWTISDGANLTIELAGVIPAGTHAVLERTSDASAPGTAWQIYTGSLVNTGATLVLSDASGGSNSEVDRVIGGADWELIGGDNDTKDTAQLSSRGWVTAPATPGQAVKSAAQATAVSQAAESDSTSTTNINRSTRSTQRSDTSSAPVQLSLPDITLQLRITAPEIVYVNQPVKLKVTPSGVGDTIARSLTYSWNFGDSHTGVGQETTHAYQHPGNYVVVVAGQYKRQQQFERHEVVVLPVSLELQLTPAGDVAVQNTSQLEIDLAGYRLAGQQTFTFPRHSIVLPQSQVIIPHERFQTSSSPVLVVLYDQAGVPVATSLPEQLAAPARALSTAAPVPARPTPRISAIDDSPDFMFASAQPVAAAADIADATPSPSPPASAVPRPQVAAAASAALPTAWPQYTLVAILLLGIAAVYLVPRKEKDDSPWP